MPANKGEERPGGPRPTGSRDTESRRSHRRPWRYASIFTEEQKALGRRVVAAPPAASQHVCTYRVIPFLQCILFSLFGFCRSRLCLEAYSRASVSDWPIMLLLGEGRGGGVSLTVNKVNRCDSGIIFILNKQQGGQEMASPRGDCFI